MAATAFRRTSARTQQNSLAWSKGGGDGVQADFGGVQFGKQGFDALHDALLLLHWWQRHSRLQYFFCGNARQINAFRVFHSITYKIQPVKRPIEPTLICKSACLENQYIRRADSIKICNAMFIQIWAQLAIKDIANVKDTFGAQYPLGRAKIYRTAILFHMLQADIFIIYLKCIALLFRQFCYAAQPYPFPAFWQCIGLLFWLWRAARRA